MGRGRGCGGAEGSLGTSYQAGVKWGEQGELGARMLGSLPALEGGVEIGAQVPGSSPSSGSGVRKD